MDSSNLIYEKIAKKEDIFYVISDILHTNLRQLEKLLENGKYEENKIKLVTAIDKKRVYKTKKFLNSKRILLAYYNDKLKIKEILTSMGVIIKGNTVNIQSGNKMTIMNTYVATTRKHIVSSCKRMYDRFIIVRSIVKKLPDGKVNTHIVLVDASKELNLMKALNGVHFKNPFSKEGKILKILKPILNFKNDYPYKMTSSDMVLMSDKYEVEAIKEVFSNIENIDINNEKEKNRFIRLIKETARKQFLNLAKEQTKGFARNYIIFVIALISIVIGGIVIVFFIP